MSTIPIRIFHDQAMLVGESPIWHAEEQSLYWIDIPNRAIHRRHETSGEHVSWALPSEPGCIAIHSDGGLVVAMRSEIALLDTQSGELRPLTPAPYDTGKMRFNDGKCDAAGRLWAGTMYEPRDQPLGSLFCLEHGKLSERGSPVTVSNGLAFSPDSSLLYHADTTAHAIYCYDFDLDLGRFSNKQVFKQFSTDRTKNYGGRPDGAAVDSEGAYWIAMYEGSRVLRFSPSGELLLEIPLPVRCPTMVTFGGQDMRTLFVTSASQNRPEPELAAYPLSGTVLALQVDVPGLPGHRYVS